MWTALSAVPVTLLPITIWFVAVASWISVLNPRVVFSTPVVVTAPAAEPIKVLECPAPSKLVPAPVPIKTLSLPVRAALPPSPPVS